MIEKKTAVKPTEAPKVKTSASTQAKEKSASQPVVKPGEITEIDLARLFELREADQVLLIDVRPGLYYRLGHLPGAISFPKSSNEAALTALEPKIRSARQSGQVVVLYCTDVNCPDGHSVAKRLAAKGHSVSLYKGGWEEWKSSGLE